MYKSSTGCTIEFLENTSDYRGKSQGLSENTIESQGKS